MSLHRVVLGVVIAAGLSRTAWAEEPKDVLPPPPAGKAWKLAWHDEFNGTRLDESKWEIPPDMPRVDGWWMRKAISLDGKGHLDISVTKDGNRYVSGCVRTRGKFEHAFGYYVARLQFHKQLGHWTAFWLYNDCVNRVGDEGRDGTEIDIVERPWLNDCVQHTLNWDGYGIAHKQKKKLLWVPGVKEGFHTIGLLWLPDEYRFYVDGKETWRTNAGGVCQVPLYVKLSDEVGWWGGNIKRAKLPDHFLVDYVRVYDLVKKP
jgi:beta-glucanase (GH16 family)